MTHRLRSAFMSADERPISFVLGAGVSVGAAPSTRSMVGYFKNAMSADAEDARDLEALLVSTPEHDMYQVAAQFVIERAGISRLNRVVRIAVLSARTPPLKREVAETYLNDHVQLEALENDWQGWALPQGLQALGRLLEIVPPESRGPILTTNFDPLIEASLRASGLIPHRISSDVDGNIPLSPPLANVVQVNHLHGYWNEGDTLHTGAQLTRSRPKLLSSLRQLLTRTTCIVLGYGGWDDLLTRSMLQLVEEGAERDIEILWGCHGSTPQLGPLTAHTLPGRLQPYVGVDVNRLLPAVDKAVRDRLNPAPKRALGDRGGVAPVPAFEDVTPAFLSNHLLRDSSPINAISYFDGRPPTWVDALGDRAPTLDRTREIEASLATDLGSHLAYLVSGPTGEGKSTMLRQLAGSLADKPGNRVLWLSSTTGFKARDIWGLTATSSKVWVLIDDADIYANSISTSVSELDRLGRDDVRFLLAARDGDWTRAIQLQSANIPSRLLRVFDVGGITENDAESITTAWSKFGDRALGKLAAEPVGVRASTLFEASQGASEGALLGAMLETRYGNDFRQHIWELMHRLSRVPLPHENSLLQAYGAICIFHHYGISNLTLAQLGSWLDISESDIDGLVVYRLGREAAAERRGDKVVPRHRRIAREVVELLAEFGIQEADLVRDLVSSVVRSAHGAHWGQETIAVTYSGQRLENKAMALAAADGAVMGDPNQLRLANYRLATYRDFEEPDRALQIARTAWENLSGFTDIGLTLRRFFISWARAAGQSGAFLDSAALNACALLDAPQMSGLSRDEATRALNGIALSLGRLPDAARHSTGRGACAESALFIAETPELREQAARQLREAERDGYSQLDATRQRGAILATVKQCISSSSVPPARRFNTQARTLTRLFEVLSL